MTVKEMLKFIPAKWRDAEITTERLSSHYPVQRIALHKDANGRKVVAIADEPINVKKT